MSIYIKEDPEFFNQAMLSITENQTIRPNEIILVKDGPLSLNLNHAISFWDDKLGDIFFVVELKRNLGLGRALKIGMRHCSNELIARMDTDDISRSNRFEVQIEYMRLNPECDILGSFVTEFEKDADVVTSYRNVPISHSNIIKSAKLKNPFNHPSVMYRKSAVLMAGGYRECHGFEDYYLWIRMILNGAHCFNISEPLVNMRVGCAMLSRRGGFWYAINEVKFQYKLLNLGFISYLGFVKNLLIRIPIRLLPNIIRSFFYKIIRRYFI